MEVATKSRLLLEMKTGQSQSHLRTLRGRSMDCIIHEEKQFL